MKTILKDEEKTQLLIKMFEVCDIEHNEIEAKRFRANHYEFRGKIDELESAHFIERKDDVYKLQLIALAELEETVPECKIILDVCEVLFQELKREYLQEPEQTIFLINIAYKYKMRPELITLSTPYFLQASIFSGYRYDEEMGACVTTREEILDYDNFRHCIEKFQGYSLQATQRSNEFHELQLAENSISLLNNNFIDIQPLLHSEIVKHSYRAYQNGHLREAVLNSVMALLDMVRNKTQLEEDGDRLIGKAFSIDDPYLKINNLSNESERSDHLGFVQMLKGANQGIRNPKAHSLSHDLNELKAAQYLIFASMLARRIEEAEVMRMYQKDAA